jgi:MFS transporter, ACS family, hexuronate transporter
VASSEDQITGPVASATTRSGRYRWRICALLFAATTLNYVDRQVLGVLAPDLTQKFGWSELDYSYIVTAFQAAYAIGLVSAGALIDKLGTRIGYALAICVWSLAAMSHALAGSVLGFAAARFLLGLGEAGNFPAAIKTVAEWFPRRERAFATGLFNSGSNVGAIVAPLTVPIVAVTWGWQVAFLFTGVLSAIWLITWLAVYRPPAEHPKLSPDELSLIRSDPDEPAVRLPWAQLLRHRQAWAFVVAKFLTDPIWWFFLFWLPKFLNQEYGLTLTGLGPPLIAIYLLADVGSIGGGWLAGRLIKRGWSVNKARKSAMLLCALSVVPIMFASSATSLWVAVALIGLATAGHQGWSANVFTLTSDMFPRYAVASVVGLGGLAGAVGGMLISTFVGFLLQATGSYVPVFIMAGSAYLIALAAVHWLVPRLEQVKLAQ